MSFAQSLDLSKEESVANLPTDVHKKEQLSLLPEELLSDDSQRPLFLKPHKYALRPLFYSVLFILIIEGLERFTYYGISSTETAFLIGTYDPAWNPGQTDVQAASFTSASVGIAYSAPFIGGIIADGLLGDYWGIIFGVSVLYIPGLILIALTTFPDVLGSTFNTNALTAGLLVLMPVGTGFIKSVVNVFGAKQYHPLLQASQLESYYVNFYLAINVGSLLGTTLIPVLAQLNLQVAYTIPACALGLGLMVFIVGSKRYVRRPPEKKALLKTLKLLGNQLACKPFDASKVSNGGDMADSFVDGVKRLLLVVPISLLVLPFVIAYSQMATVFVIQGEAMRNEGLLDASLMQMFDPISVLIAGVLVGSFLYPALSERGIRIPLTHKFAIGTAFGGLALAAAIIVDHAIRRQYNADYTQISILWQAFSYLLVGCGEVLTIASCLEAAFSIAPKEQKGLASAMNQFLSLGLASFICVAMNNACASWFPQSSDGANRTEMYAESEMGKFLWVPFGITVLGVLVNIFPPIKNWADSLHQEAIEAAASVASSNLELEEKSEATKSEQADLERESADEFDDISLSNAAK